MILPEMADEEFRPLQALMCEHALAFFVNFQHVLVSHGMVPAKNLLENVGDIFHKIHLIVPANHRINWIMIFAAFRGGCWILDRADKGFRRGRHGCKNKVLPCVCPAATLTHDSSSGVSPKFNKAGSCLQVGLD